MSEASIQQYWIGSYVLSREDAAAEIKRLQGLSYVPTKRGRVRSSRSIGRPHFSSGRQRRAFGKYTLPEAATVNDVMQAMEQEVVAIEEAITGKRDYQRAQHAMEVLGELEGTLWHIESTEAQETARREEKQLQRAQEEEREEVHAFHITQASNLKAKFKRQAAYLREEQQKEMKAMQAAAVTASENGAIEVVAPIEGGGEVGGRLPPTKSMLELECELGRHLAFAHLGGENMFKASQVAAMMNSAQEKAEREHQQKSLADISSREEKLRQQHERALAVQSDKHARLLNLLGRGLEVALTRLSAKRQFQARRAMEKRQEERKTRKQGLREELACIRGRIRRSWKEHNRLLRPGSSSKVQGAGGGASVAIAGTTGGGIGGNRGRGHVYEGGIIVSIDTVAARGKDGLNRDSGRKGIEEGNIGATSLKDKPGIRGARSDDRQLMGKDQPPTVGDKAQANPGMAGGKHDVNTCGPAWGPDSYLPYMLPAPKEAYSRDIGGRDPDQFKEVSATPVKPGDGTSGSKTISHGACEESNVPGRFKPERNSRTQQAEKMLRSPTCPPPSSSQNRSATPSGRRQGPPSSPALPHSKGRATKLIVKSGTRKETQCAKPPAPAAIPSLEGGGVREGEGVLLLPQPPPPHPHNGKGGSETVHQGRRRRQYSSTPAAGGEFGQQGSDQHHQRYEGQQLVPKQEDAGSMLSDREMGALAVLGRSGALHHLDIPRIAIPAANEATEIKLVSTLAEQAEGRMGADAKLQDGLGAGPALGVLGIREVGGLEETERACSGKDSLAHSEQEGWGLVNRAVDKFVAALVAEEEETRKTLGMPPLSSWHGRASKHK